MMVDEAEDEFLDAFDRRETRRIWSSLSAATAAGGANPEQARVGAIIARDRQARAREIDRRQAEMELAKGVFVNLADSVLAPTPEWLAGAETRPFVPKQPAGTVRTIRTVRRVVTPIVARMHRAGTITDDQLRSALWYRVIYEKAGLEGRYCSTQLDKNGDSVVRTNASIAGHIPTTLDEAYSRQLLRAAKKSISPYLIRYFEAIVIDDLPPRRAARFIRCANNRAAALFRKAANELVVFCESNEVDLLGIGRN